MGRGEPKRAWVFFLTFFALLLFRLGLEIRAFDLGDDCCVSELLPQDFSVCALAYLLRARCGLLSSEKSCMLPCRDGCSKGNGRGLPTHACAGLCADPRGNGGRLSECASKTSRRMGETRSISWPSNVAAAFFLKTKRPMTPRSSAGNQRHPERDSHLAELMGPRGPGRKERTPCHGCLVLERRSVLICRGTSSTARVRMTEPTYSSSF